MAPIPPLSSTSPEASGARVPARIPPELSDETINQGDASLVFVKLRQMIASDTQATDTILGTIAVAAHSLTGATGAAIAMPRDGAVVCVGRSGEAAPELGDRLNVDSGISGECLRTGVIMRCDDAGRDFHVDAEVCRQLGLQSIAVVPLRGQQGRVGVLEAFSNQSYAFSEEKMELLGRLAGLAEAAWARGALTEVSAGAGPEAVLAGEGPVEIQPEPAPLAMAAIPLAQVREVLATAQLEEARAARKWRIAGIAAAAVLGLILLSFFGWRAWYRASLRSRAAPPRATAPAGGNSTAGAGFTSSPDVVRPASRPRPLPATLAARPAAPRAIPDQVIRKKSPPAQPADSSSATAAAPSDQISSSEDIPQIASAGAGAADLGKVLATPSFLPKLGVPVSQGVAGGVLMHKVQPVYPAEARRLRVQGAVVLDAIVTVQGRVDDLKLVSGDAMLAEAAMAAVRQWRYSPYSLNGKPIPKPTRITVSFIAP